MASGPLGQDLLCALHVDFEEDVGPRRRVGDWRPHQVVEEFGPFEEAAPTDRVFERRPIHEDIRGPLAFTRPWRTGGPTATQPEVGILRHEFRGERALSGPSGADEHEDARLAGRRFSVQSL